MRKTIIAAVAAGGLLAAAALPANAGIGDVELDRIVGDWEALDTDDGTGDPYPGSWSPGLEAPSANSTITGPHTAELVWPEDGPNLGTSLEIADFGDHVPSGFAIDVGWQLSDGATFSGGAPRIFIEVDGVYYDSTQPSSDGFLVLADENGATIFGLPGGDVGHIGIVYDNGVAGKVNIVSPFRLFAEEWDLHVLFAPDENGNGDEGNGDNGGDNGDGSLPDTELPENGPPHTGGRDVADEVRNDGGPPSHAKGKGGAPTGGHLP